MAIVEQSPTAKSHRGAKRASTLGAALHLERQVPVVVFEGGLTGASTARILNQRGIRTYSLMNDPGIYRHSRYYRALPGPIGSVFPDAILSFLEDLKLSEAVLVPCADDWLRAVGTLELDNRSRFFASVPPLDAIETVVDKWKFAQAASRLEVPHPRTRIIHSPEELHHLSDEEIRGFFLKPVNSLEFCRRHGVKALFIGDRETALRRAEKINFPIMLQEYIPGPATSHYFIDGFIDRHGGVCALFARRRLRMYPPKIGNSSLLVSIPLQEIQPAAESLRSVLDGLRYRGVFSAEFKYDKRDGKFKILEVNARPWWYVEFAAQCGVDVCTMAYRDALGMEVTPVWDYHVGRRCVHLSNDFAGLIRRADGFPGSFFSWAKSVTGAYDPIFRWSDPGPYVAFAFNRLARHKGK